MHLGRQGGGRNWGATTRTSTTSALWCTPICATWPLDSTRVNWILKSAGKSRTHADDTP